jgi:WD40 repeat protein/serine/threonine protein kinase
MNERDLFIAALQRDEPAERVAYLDRACGDDASLRRRIDRLLRLYAEGSSLPDGQATAAGGTVDSQPGGSQRAPAPIREATLASASTPPHVETVGTRIGPYKLLQQLGEGGMGIVWVAEQTEPVKRRVALKVIKPGMDSARVLHRFEAERQALALMDHSNIAKVLDAGTTPEGRPYFVMELVKGVPITRYCDELHLSLRERLELFIPVCQAIQHAHQKGIIHRDIKPSNVLVAVQDGKPMPKVIDFGVAKALHQQLTDASVYTEIGQVVGTLEYMSPEQAELSALDVDTRADVYALGVVLYELLTGTTPFDPKRLRAAAYSEVVRLIREVEPPKPSTRLTQSKESLASLSVQRRTDPVGLMKEVRGELDWIVMRCLEKDRTRRYQTANNLARDVEHYLKDEPVEACPPSASYRLRKFARRYRAALVAVGVFVALLVLSALVSTWQAVRATVAERSAVAAFDAEAAERRLAEQQTKIATTQTAIATQRAADLAWEDYINRVNRAYREVLDDNVALAEDLLFGCAPERRAWEWHYVMRLGHLDRHTRESSFASVNRVVYSPDGSSIAFGSGKPTTLPVVGSTDHAQVEVWDVTQGRSRSLPALDGTIHSLAISPDGKRIAIGSGFMDPRIENRITLWDVAGDTMVWEKRDSVFPAVMSIAFSPDGTTLAAGYGAYSWFSAGRIRLFDVRSGRERDSFPGPRGGVNDLSFHPKGAILAIAGSGVVELRAVADGHKLRDLPGHALWVYKVAFSPDGNWLASGGWDRTIRLREVATGHERLTIFGHNGFIYGLAFSPDSRALASTSEDRSVKVWEVPSGRELVVFHGHTDFVNDVAVHPDGQQLVTGSQDGTLKVWDRRTSRSVVIDHQLPWVQRLAYRRDGNRVVSVAGTKLLGHFTTKIWDPTTGAFDPQLARFDGTSPEDLPRDYNPGVSYGQDTATSPNGSLVAQVVRPDFVRESRSRRYAGSTVEVRDAQTGQVVHTLLGHTADVTCTLFSPDGQRLATASFDRTIKLWDLVTGREVCTLRGHTAGVVSLAFSPDGRRLISGGIEGTARVWDATPLPDDALQTLEARFQQKRSMLRELTTARGDSQSAESLAQAGQWEWAAIAFGKAVERQPENPELRYWLALCHLAFGDLASYRKVCGAMVERFGMEDAPGIASRVAYTCVAGPDAVKDRPRLLQICKKAIPAFQGNERIVGAALVREGRYAEALEQFDASHRTFPPRAWDWLFRAMANHGLSRPTEARDSLERADQWISQADGKTVFQGEGTPPKWVHWSERIEVQTLHREVESLVQGRQRSASSSGTSAPTKTAPVGPGAKQE